MEKAHHYNLVKSRGKINNSNNNNSKKKIMIIIVKIIMIIILMRTIFKNFKEIKFPFYIYNAKSENSVAILPLILESARCKISHNHILMSFL